MESRALMTTIRTFMASELADDFNLEQSFEYGPIPMVFNDKYKDEILSSYISLYLREEIEE